MGLLQTEKSNDRIWRALTNLWTFAAMGFFLFDFFTIDKFSGYAAAVSIIYISILGIYVGTKEFERWQSSHHSSKRRGEWFIIVWTAIILFFIVTAIASGGKYRMPSEFTATYIALLSIFALTQRSKFLHNQKEQDINQQINNPNK